METIRGRALVATMLVLIAAVSRGEMIVGGGGVYASYNETMGGTAPGTSVCAGDCNMDGAVTISELIVGVNIALGRALRDACPALDTNNDNRVGVNELVTAVSSLLCNCGTCPTPRPTNTATRTPTATSTPPRPTPTRTPARATSTPTPPRSADSAIEPCADDCEAALDACGEDTFFEEYGSVSECTDECVSIVEDFAADAADFELCVDRQVRFIECCTRARQCGAIPDGCDDEFEDAVFGCGGSFGGCPLIFFDLDEEDD